MNYPDSPDLFEGKFTDGNPVAGIPASIASADHMNAVYDELINVITFAGGTPDVAAKNQLKTALEFYRNADNLNAGTIPTSRLDLVDIRESLGKYREGRTSLVRAVFRLAVLKDLRSDHQSEASFTIGPLGNYGSTTRDYHFVSFTCRGDSFSCSINSLTQSSRDYEYYVEENENSFSLYLRLPQYNGGLFLESHSSSSADIALINVSDSLDVSSMTKVYLKNTERRFDVSGDENNVVLRSRNGLIFDVNDGDEFSFIVTSTNTDLVTVKIDKLVPIPLVGDKLYATALITIRYISGFFYIVNQINPKTGNAVNDIGKLFTDTVDTLNDGEYALDGSAISSIDHPIACAKALASSNYVVQTKKDADPIRYGGYYGFFNEQDGSTTVTLPNIGGEFIRMFDDGRGVDTGRVFGSHQSDEFRSHYHGTHFTAFDNTGSGESYRIKFDDGPAFNNQQMSMYTGSNETRPRSIAYYGKTRL